MIFSHFWWFNWFQKWLEFRLANINDINLIINLLQTRFAIGLYSFVAILVGISGDKHMSCNNLVSLTTHQDMILIDNFFRVEFFQFGYNRFQFLNNFTRFFGHIISLIKYKHLKVSF